MVRIIAEYKSPARTLQLVENERTQELLLGHRSGGDTEELRRFGSKDFANAMDAFDRAVLAHVTLKVRENAKCK